jgi:hypothetical protein
MIVMNEWRDNWNADDADFGGFARIFLVLLQF